MTSTSSYPGRVEEKDNSSEETDFKPRIKNGPLTEEVNGREHADEPLPQPDDMSFDELKRQYDLLLAEVHNIRRENGVIGDGSEDVIQSLRAQITELRIEKEALEQLLNKFNDGAFVDVDEVTDLRSTVTNRLMHVRKLLTDEVALRTRIFSDLQQATIEKDRAIAAVRELQFETKDRLRQLQSSIRASNDGVSLDLHEELRRKYHQSEEKRTEAQLTVEDLSREVKKRDEEKEAWQREKAALLAEKGNLIKKFTKKMQNDKNKFTKEQRVLEDRCREAEVQAQSATSRTTELENEKRRLERDLEIRTNEYDALRAEDRSQQLESSKKLRDKEKAAERQVEAEKQIRYQLEQRLNVLEEEKKSFESQMQTLGEKCEKLQREQIQATSAHDEMQRKAILADKKLEEIRLREREMDSAKSDAEARAIQLDQRCANLTQEISNLQKALEKKVRAEKSLKQRERDVQEREKRINAEKKRIERSAQQTSQSKPSARRGAVTRAPKHEKHWDPFFQYRTLFPWPWMFAFLLVLLFFGVLLRR